MKTGEEFSLSLTHPSLKITLGKDILVKLLSVHTSAVALDRMAGGYRRTREAAILASIEDAIHLCRDIIEEGEKENENRG